MLHNYITFQFLEPVLTSQICPCNTIQFISNRFNSSNLILAEIGESSQRGVQEDSFKAKFIVLPRSLNPVPPPLVRPNRVLGPNQHARPKLPIQIYTPIFATRAFGGRPTVVGPEKLTAEIFRYNLREHPTIIGAQLPHTGWAPSHSPHQCHPSCGPPWSNHKRSTLQPVRFRHSYLSKLKIKVNIFK